MRAWHRRPHQAIDNVMDRTIESPERKKVVTFLLLFILFRDFHPLYWWPVYLSIHVCIAHIVIRILGIRNGSYKNLNGPFYAIVCLKRKVQCGQWLPVSENSINLTLLWANGYSSNTITKNERSPSGISIFESSVGRRSNTNGESLNNVALIYSIVLSSVPSVSIVERKQTNKYAE